MYKRLAVLLIVVLIVIAGGAVWFQKFHKNKYTHENVQSQVVDLSTAKGTDKLPQGFPKGVPADLTNVSNSFSSNYVDRNLTVSGFTYTSSQDKKTLYEMYASYFKMFGYSVDKTVSNLDSGYIVGRRDATELSIQITENTNGGNNNAKTSVTLAYTVRK